MKKGTLRSVAGSALLIALFIAGTLQPIQAEPGQDKKEDIKKLLIFSGIHEQLDYMKTNLINTFGQVISMTYPKIPEPFWNDLGNLIQQREMDDLIDRVVVVYDKHMSHEVVKELIKMFNTPFWKEWRKKMPVISREAGIVGSRWGQEISQGKDFQKKIDVLIDKYELEKLNAVPERPGEKEQANPSGQ
ncbi:MAG: DUF2059 domain-containing protein [Nitrospinae bacterium]|nr:DUF2059 domain-containing protein [Nitrospinota bacterium]